MDFDILSFINDDTNEISDDTGNVISNDTGNVGSDDISDIDYDITSYIGGKIDHSGGIDKNSAATKDYVQSTLIPDNISECSILVGNKPVCVSDNIIKKMQTIIPGHTPQGTMEIAKKQLGCNSQKCVLEKLSNQLGREEVVKEISLYLKIQGPTDDTLLSNIHIDNTLKQWMYTHSEFFAWNFNMLNYASYSYVNGRVINRPDTLATIQFSDLCLGNYDGKKYKCGGCVINSDVYQNGGIHWMALFADTRSDPWTVEFFNSSGNSPAPEWVNWMEKTKNCMHNLQTSLATKPDIVSTKVSSIRHQKSRTECGLYSLFYIWARLNGIPYTYFAKNSIPDQLMFEFRHHLFDDPSRKSIKKFEWNDYKNEVKLKWE